MSTLSIVLPAYNEEKRLPRTFQLLREAIDQGVFSSTNLVEILVVNDGSKDATADIVRNHMTSQPLLKLIDVHPNAGKGNAIHEGLKQARSEWCLIADADSATPWNQYIKLNKNCVTADGTRANEVAIGSRDLPESDVRQKQSWVRENMGRTFNFLVRLITGLSFRDTQCGFKLIHKPSASGFLNELRVKRFAWDVEFLMFAKDFGLKTVEVPVEWEHQDASRVNPVKDSLEMLFRVVQLRFRLMFMRKKT